MSLLDYIFTLHNHVGRFSRALHHPRGLSDHSHVLVTLLLHTQRPPLWEAMKPTIRGIDVSYRTAEKRKHAEQRIGLETHCSTLEADYAMAPNPTLRRRLSLAQQKLNQHLTEEVKEIWLASQYRIYQW